MSLNPGVRFGPYEILSALGAGGMGEVYRARDTTLGRDVAIKVLPAEFVAHVDRRARFEREARLLASLNHPNIATIHGIEQVDGEQAIVLELIEGDTLRERLIRGALPLADALRFAIAIADALDAAHEKGVVHRDLKPGNIKITPAGMVKVLDFGLAKAASDDRAGRDLTQSPTITVDGTRGGTILGTAAYMSPEQARGQAVDKRADIWAFGCVLYEMLTGRQAFAGDTVTDVLAMILEREPNLQLLPSDTPSKIRDLIRRCLQKDPRRRLHDMADARLELEEAVSSPEVDRATIDGQTSRRWSTQAVAASLVLGALGAGAFAWVLRPAAAPETESIRFAIETPPMPFPHSMAISPDGRSVAFVAIPRPNDPTMLFVRHLGSLDSHPVSGTEGAIQPFWSPDSQHLGFSTQPPTRQLKTVEVTGGRPRVLSDLAGGLFRGGTWNSANIIVFSNGQSLYRVPAAGGIAIRLAKVDRSRGETAHLWPHFLPDGDRYLYLAMNVQAADHAIFIGSLESGETTRLMRSESSAAYAPPHFLLFMRQQTLLAQPFDTSSLTLTGEPAPIAEGVLRSAGTGRAFAVSDTGTLVYRTGAARDQRSLVWIDRSGRTSGTIGDPLTSILIRLSPDGKRVAFAEAKDGAAEDVWIYDLERNQKSLLTSGPGIAHLPVWSPDGSRVGFDSSPVATDENHVIYERRADGATPKRILVQPEPGVGYGLLDWTAHYIVFQKSTLEARMVDIWAQALSGDRKAFQYVPRLAGTTAVLSPNGRWLAYVVSEAGVNQVIVQSFPDRSRSRKQISSRGGAYPRWRRDGRELFYLDPDRKLIAVSVVTDGPFEVQKSIELFDAPIQFPQPGAGGLVGSPYDVTGDGERFLFSAQAGALASSPPITVVLNWTAELKK